MLLTNVGEYRNGRLCHWYEVGTRRVLACDSTLNVLLIIELFADEELLEESKAQLLPLMLLAEPETALDGVTDPVSFISELLWQVCGIDVTGQHESLEKTFDWDEDAERIKASLYMAYGLDWSKACKELSFKETCDLLGMLLETKQSTPFGEALYYRTAKPPKPNKYNEEEIKAFKKMQSYFSLKSGADYEPEREANSIFDRIWKEVANG